MGTFNIDSGTGRARALSVFGPPEAATVLRDALAPFSDLGFAGVTAIEPDETPAVRTAHRSMPPACQASADDRTRSNTSTLRGIRTSTLTNALSSPM